MMNSEIEKRPLISITRAIDLYIRVVVLLLALTAGLAFLFIGTRAALAASIKPVSVINGDTLRLGDVFDGLSGDKAAYVLGPAPQPGQDMTLNASTLMRVASALQLPWKPASSADQVIIRRAATVVAESDIRDAINAALMEKGLEGKFNLLITGTMPQIVLPPEAAPSVEVESVKFDPARDWFEISLAAPSTATPLTHASIMGRVQRMVSVPVLKTALRNGDLIGMNDIIWIEMEQKDLQADNILREEDMTGLTPRHMAAAGKPLRANELQRPVMVGRGDSVTLIFKSGPMILTAKGKAMQDGAEGDLVRFVNVASNRTLDGIVSGDHEITVSD